MSFTVDPAIVHHVAMQPTLLGIVASFGRKFASVYGITGLEHAFITDSSKARSLRRGFRLLLRFGLNRRRAVGLVQNPDDREVLAGPDFPPSLSGIVLPSIDPFSGFGFYPLYGLTQEWNTV